MNADQLYVVGAYNNPRRWQSRERLAIQWLRRTVASGVHVVFVQHATGDLPFDIDPRAFPDVTMHLLRGRPEHYLWLKEALINYGIGHLPEAAEYVCWEDTDVEHLRPDWAAETVRMLQQHRIGQTWSASIDLGPFCEVVPNEWGNHADRSFARAWLDGDVDVPGDGYGPPPRRFLERPKAERKDWRQHYGFSWAIRRDALHGIGRLIDWLVTGSADYHMALGFAGKLRSVLESELRDNREGRLSEAYLRKLRQFGERCDQHIKQDIGCVDGALAHHWHGRKKDRGYISRKDIILQSEFDPDVDLEYDTFGLPFLASDNRVLRDGLRRYFAQRNEDSVDL